MKVNRFENTVRNRRMPLSQKQLVFCSHRIDIQRFLEKDENSKLCPGKKDTITRRGKKKQKRYLSDTLENLYKKYNSESNRKISYTTFTRFRPFWVVTPKVTERDTCLCVTHENFSLVTQKLKQLNIIKEKTIDDICDSVVCNKKAFECMTRKCQKCVDKMLKFETFDNDEEITYKQWMTKTETRIIKGQEKNIKRTVKDLIKSKKIDLINKFVDMLPNFLKHKFTIWHQYQSITAIKKCLKSGEALLHIDFSENFQCKYASEAQSVHFGASRQQLSLHTCVIYFCNDSGVMETISFSSVSECLRHDAAAIYAHLKKSLKQLCEDKNISFQKLHVLSDGPSNQYKNKSNFYLFTQHLVNLLDLKSATWNFSEAGHGKGAADGVGAVIKRTADSLVAHGEDIPDYTTFVVKMICRTNVRLYTVTESDIIEADNLIPKTLKTIPNTSKIHQITWSCEYPNKLFLRQLSCTECSLETVCPHFLIANGYFDYPVSAATACMDDVDAGPSAKLVENEKDSEDVLPCTSEAKCDTTEDITSTEIGSWVIVQFEGKKSTLHFVGKTIATEKNDNELSYVVKFVRKKNIDLGIFIWPETEDISQVFISDIKGVLPEPVPSRRGEFVFNFDFLNKNFTFK